MDINSHKPTIHEHSKDKDVKEELGDEFLFERIPILKGTTDIGYSEITLLKEIPTDAKIVTNGAFFILAKMTNSGEEE